jgi:hypothetical protein
MTGKPITQQQVKLFMSYRNHPHHTQASAAAKAGISERSARRIEIGDHQAAKAQRNYATRKDPFNGLFEQIIIPLLEDNSGLQPITLLDVLEHHAPGLFDQSHLRTLQRRVKRWRAKHGPEKDVIFRQNHTPGEMGISDYTWMNKLNITISGAEFKHKLFHYRLTYSGWTYVQVILGGESFESLSSGLQNAFWRCGEVPATHRTDSLSAAFKNHSEETLLTERCEKLCQYYNVIATRNNKGVAHENGAIESAHGHLKQKIDQQLMLRGSRDFNQLKDYEKFLNLIVAKINRQGRTRFDEERTHLKPLPSRRTNDFSEQYVKVSSSSTILVKRVTYTVPSRLIRASLLIHIFDERLELFYGHESILTLPRVYAQAPLRARSVDYRHIIHSLAKKPNAFKCSQLREDIIPDGDFRLLWKQLTQEYVSDTDCRYMVGLLLLADNYNCEDTLGRYVLKALNSGNRASIETCRNLFGPDKIEVPNIVSQQHSVQSYDVLIGVSSHG